MRIYNYLMIEGRNISLEKKHFIGQVPAVSSYEHFHSNPNISTTRTSQAAHKTWSLILLHKVYY